MWGRVIYQRKKNRSQCNKALGFCLGTAIGFLVAASKTDGASKTKYFQIKNRSMSKMPFGFCFLQIYIQIHNNKDYSWEYKHLDRYKMTVL